MTYFMRKMLILITLSITSISYSYAYYDNSSTYDECDSCYSCQPVCCSNIFFNAEILYWRAFESGLDRCFPSVISNVVTGDNVGSILIGRGMDPNFKWDPGFRIGVGYEFTCNNWDIDASWTHFNSHVHGSNSVNDLLWKIDYDVIDLTSGYEFEFYTFAFRPFGGLRGARIDQNLSLNEFISSSSTTIYENNDEKFYGLGPIIGFDTDWNIGNGFSLFFNASISWLYGNFDVRLMESSVTVDSSSLSNISKRLNAIVTGADAEIGIRWYTCICTNQQLLLQLGLEHHQYFNFNRICDNGDLSFDGVNFSVGVGF